MRKRIFGHIAAALAATTIGGCAGGASCSGVTPLAGGFKLESRVENAGSIRVTSSGMDFLGKDFESFASLVLGFPSNAGVLEIPLSGGADPTVMVCPGGADPSVTPPKCVTEIDLASSNFKEGTVVPTELRLSGAFHFRVQDLPIELTPGGPASVSLNGNGACPPNAQTFAPIPATFGLTLEADQKTTKLGYTRGRVAEVTIDKQAIKNAVHVCGGGGGAVPDSVIDLFHAEIVAGFSDALSGAICLHADSTLALPCPKGTHNVEGLCRYGTTTADECVALLLGTDGHLDLGAALSSVAPGAKSGLDFVFALGGDGVRSDGSGMKYGDLNPINGGATIGLYGGLDAAPASQCVTPAKLDLPTGIPVPDELLGNTLPGWPAGSVGPDIGIALSERFVNYALGQAYNSGLFCLAVSTSTVDQLSSNTLSLLANSIKELGLQEEGQQVAVVVRPSSPPHAEIGGGTSLSDDPLLRVTLNQVSFDLYMWSLDRFVRFMTVTADVAAPVNLTVTKYGLEPVVDKLAVNSTVVTNSELLREDPAKIAAAFQDVVGGLVGQALGSAFAPIDINNLLLSGLGLSLSIPDTVDGKGSPGLRRLTKNTDDFLGIFGTGKVTKKSKSPPNAAPGARAEVVTKEIDPAGVRLRTMTADNAPVITIEMGSDSESEATPVEYAYRVDQGLWRPFRQERVVDIEDPWMRLQGRHYVEVRSRFVGDPMSLDEEPASLEVLVDVDPPSIEIGAVDDRGTASIKVSDFVSGEERTMVRSRLDEGAWSAWAPAAESLSVNVGDVGANAHELTVEARDEEGNVATASQALIRGGAIAGAAGCGCVAAGQDQPSTPWAALASTAALALALRMKRRR